MYRTGWEKTGFILPTSSTGLATECANRNHSAAYPTSLHEWFIRLFTKENDLVLDPFIGSGTTALASVSLGRHYLGIELQEIHYRQALGANSGMATQVAYEQSRFIA